MIFKGKQSELIPSHYNTVDYYKWYTQLHCYKNRSSKYYVTQGVFTTVLKRFFQLAMEEKIFNGEEIVFPYNMGRLFIRKVKTAVKLDNEGKVINHLPVDFGATNKLWKENPKAAENKILVRHLNKHTNGYVFKFIYNKDRSRFKNKSAYRFEPTRTHKRHLAKLAKSRKNRIDFLIKK